MKRGQVTVFIIVGLVILVLAAFLFRFSESIQPEKPIINNEKAAVTSFVESCIDEVTHEAIYVVSTQGGYYQVKLPYYEHPLFDVPYYFDKKAFLPQKKEIELQVALFIDENLDICIDRVGLLWDVNYQNSKTKVTIGLNELIIDVNLPMEITKGTQITSLNSFSITKPAELGRALDIQKKILVEQDRFINEIPVSYIVELAEEENILVDLAHLDGTVLFNLQFPHSNYNNNLYTYTFAAKYDW